MARIEKTVFISYRRKDISWALAVYQYLTSHEYDVFFDYTSISSGDFEQIIASNIRARAHFILILTPTALDRCNEPGDWLRREIETAIDEKRNIIPLFFDDFSFSSPAVAEKLTGKLAELGHYNGLDIPPRYFPEAMQRLSSRYLNVPLDAVIHPVSSEVQKAVKEEQIAVNRALAQRWENIKELLRPAEEKSVESKQLQIEATKAASLSGKGGWDKPRRTNFRLYGIAVGILVALGLGIAAINMLLNSQQNAIPTMTSQVVENPINFQPSLTAPVNTATVESQTSTPTEEPTFTVTPAPTLGVGSTKVSLQDGMVMVYVPAGEFHMGFQGQASDEKPVHTVSLDAFWMDQTEVTNAMYDLCVSDGKCNRPSSFSSRTRPKYYRNSQFNDYPVIYVSWDDADSYCAWSGRRLPTEAEWEKAARGRDQRSYPWGEGIDCDHANYFDGKKFCVKDTSRVKSYEAGISPYGIYDMAGNVWEWVADWYLPDYYDISPTSNPAGPATPSADKLRVARGGSWDDTDLLARSSNRGSFSPVGVDSRGFRCAASAAP
jgi:formylglycine-generating enzyme required for sulfatase activity